MFKRIFSILIVFGVLLTTIHSGSFLKSDIVNAANDPNLGDLSHYNALVFGEMNSAQADIEGAVAVLGRANLGTLHGFDVGGATPPSGISNAIGVYENKNNYPTLLLGSDVGLKKGNPVHVYNGPIVMSESAHGKYTDSKISFSYGDVKTTKDEKVNSFFSKAQADISNLQSALFSLDGEHLGQTKRSISSSELAKFKVANKNVLSINLDNAAGGTEKVGVGEISFPKEILDYDYVVINSNAKKVEFTGGAIFIDGESDINNSKFLKIRKLAEKLIWNFPEAETVNLSEYALIGSLLASKADFSGNGGSVNGMMAVKSFDQKGGMEAHSFKMSPLVWGLAEGEEIVVGEVELLKVDSDNEDKVLSGATFELYDSKDRLLGKYTTDKDGKIKVDELEDGSYYFNETKAPSGYILDSKSIDFKITGENDSVNVTVKNKMLKEDKEEATGSVELVKVDIDNEDIVLGDTVFELYDSSDKLVSKYTTDEDGKIELDGLAYGDYYFKEIKAPSGYSLDDNPIDFEITKEDDKAGVFSRNKILKENEITVLRGAELVKIDNDDEDKVLSGAVFALYDSNDKLIGKYTTDEDGKIAVDDLEYGSYSFKEVEAPSGYVLDDTAIEFTLDKGEDVFSTTVKNKKIEGSKGDLGADTSKFVETGDYSLRSLSILILFISSGLYAYSRRYSHR